MQKMESWKVFINQHAKYHGEGGTDEHGKDSDCQESDGEDNAMIMEEMKMERKVILRTVMTVLMRLESSVIVKTVMTVLMSMERTQVAILLRREETVVWKRWVRRWWWKWKTFYHPFGQVEAEDDIGQSEDSAGSKWSIESFATEVIQEQAIRHNAERNPCMGAANEKSDDWWTGGTQRMEADTRICDLNGHCDRWATRGLRLRHAALRNAYEYKEVYISFWLAHVDSRHLDLKFG